jgi:hypothetical protein
MRERKICVVTETGILLDEDANILMEASFCNSLFAQTLVGKELCH